MVTYEQLFDTLRREKSRDELQELEPAFYTEAKAFLAEKEAAMSGDQHALTVQRARIEYQNIKKILKELYDRRERKIITMAMHKTRTNSAVITTDGLLAEERVLFDKIVTLLQGTRTELFTFFAVEEEPVVTPVPAAPEAVEPEEKHEEESKETAAPEAAPDPTSEQQITVKFLSQVPKFVGKNLEIFGPFEEGMSAELPDSVAQILIKKGRAVSTS
ncbi:MAG: hypothetical protein OXR66_00535 [Candidatus Woesearchaeota archaeon]|nr:hypothetical protein [Candidatus Woesearchaeota archaeon]